MKYRIEAYETGPHQYLNLIEIETLAVILTWRCSAGTMSSSAELDNIQALLTELVVLSCQRQEANCRVFAAKTPAQGLHF